VNSLPKTVTRQRRDCDLNPGPSAPESSMLTTWLRSHQDKTSLHLNETRNEGGFGCNVMSWTMCKQSAPHSRQITTPTPCHSVFTGWMLFLMPNQQCQSNVHFTIQCNFVLSFHTKSMLIHLTVESYTIVTLLTFILIIISTVYSITTHSSFQTENLPFLQILTTVAFLSSSELTPWIPWTVYCYF